MVDIDALAGVDLERPMFMKLYKLLAQDVPLPPTSFTLRHRRAIALPMPEIQMGGQHSWLPRAPRQRGGRGHGRGRGRGGDGELVAAPGFAPEAAAPAASGHHDGDAAPNPEVGLNFA